MCTILCHNKNNNNNNNNISIIWWQQWKRDDVIWWMMTHDGQSLTSVPRQDDSDWEHEWYDLNSMIKKRYDENEHTTNMLMITQYWTNW